ncbi:MAG: SDR family NAD(P)-dependent oxidoreductase [Bdellovibrionales bacterium]
MKGQKILITGGAGFIGSHLSERLLADGARVTIFDNLHTGRESNLAKIIKHPDLKFIKGDIRNRAMVDEVVPGHDGIFHFCDDSDIRGAAEHPDSYVEQNVMGLFYVLEAMRKNKIKKLLFPSSTTVLGEAKWPCSESHGPLVPLSLYGGAKLAAEGLISAWAHTFDFTACVFRFVGIIGGRMDHGVVHDFVRKLEKNPTELEILGNGSQRRSFMLVDDCCDAMITCYLKINQPYRLVHVGNVDEVPIREVADIIPRAMGLKDVKINTGDGVGWKGDSTSNFILTETLDSLKWKPKHNSAQACFEAASRLAGHK